MNKLDISKIEAGMEIEYKGDSMAFGGSYTVVTAESTYTDPNTMPENEKGKLMIVEFTNDDRVMYFSLENLNPNEWALVKNEQ